MRPKFQDLYFGKSDSRNEYASQPDEFVRSFVDLDHLVDDLRSGEKFMVLGPKGTGKSAIGWYLKATDAVGSHMSLVRDASELPLGEIPRLDTGQPVGVERTVVAWKFVLLCNYLELLLSDNGCSLQRDDEVIRVANHLREFGFMGDAVGRALLKISNSTIRIPVPQVGEIYRRESKKAISIYHLLPYLEKWVCGAQSETRHLLLLDGLDSIFLNDDKYDESMGALVQAAYHLNQKFTETGASGNIVLLLRNDVFARIATSLPDSQKMRDDLSAELDWRVMSGAAGAGAPLLQLANRKAARALGQDSVDVLGYFHNDVQLGPKGAAPKWIPTLRYFLNLTRHTPRDLLRLFEEIRRVEASEMFPPSRGKISGEVIREGVVRYSSKYFVGAIRNEFAGFENGGEAALSALQAVQSQVFSKADFAKSLKETSSDAHDAATLLKSLFYAGAIGNYVRRSGRETYMQFYHRRDDSEVHLGGEFILHNALVHAWNLPHAPDA